MYFFSLGVLLLCRNWLCIYQW